MRPLVVVDSRRLLRAVALGFLVFLFVGGGVGFAVAAGEDESEPLMVPTPRPGDKIVYTAQRVLLDEDLALGGTGDIRLDHVIYQWLPETWVVGEDLSDRLAQPLQAKYQYMSGTANAVTYDRIVFYDAVDGHVLFQEFDGGGWGIKDGPFYYNDDAPVVGELQVGGTRFEQYYRTTEYGFTRTPCGAGTTALQGVPYDGGEIVLQGRCGWDKGNQGIYRGEGWQDSAAGRAFGFSAVADERLRMWFSNHMPFPVQLITSSAEITDPAWAVGRLFRLDLESFTPGSGAYTAAAATDLPSAHAVGQAQRTPWMLDDLGMESFTDLTLQEAYMAALATTGPKPTGQQNVAAWLGAHPDGYLAAAWALEYRDGSGEAMPQWIMLWVDGSSWVGKRVSWEAAGGGLFLPEQAGRQAVVTDWTPSWLPNDVDAFFPDVDQLPTTLPRPADLVDPYRRAFGAEAPVNRYGFQVYCLDEECTAPRTEVEVGFHSESPEQISGPYGFTAPAAEDREALVDKFIVDAAGQAAYQRRFIENSETMLPLPRESRGAGPTTEPSPESHAAVWTAPVTPAAATGISLVALLAAALYYFWPTLKGLPALGLFSRIRDDKVLDHPQRARMMEAIRADPGVHFQELSRRLGLGHGVLDHHLRKLVDAELVVVRRTSGYTCFFPKATDRRMMDAAPALRSGGSRAVLGAVAQKPGASSRDLAVHLGLAPSTVSYHLKRLETAGLVLPDARAGVRLTALGEQAKTPV